MRRAVREAEGARLEIVCAVRHPGFESLALRHFFRFPDALALARVSYGGRAPCDETHEPRQVRKEAAVVVPLVCRGCPGCRLLWARMHNR